MATAIHHGPFGSFKTFALVQRFALDALKEGRVVVHNIRGLSFSLIKQEFPEVVFPESAFCYQLDTDIKANRIIMAKWFHWIPANCLLIIDEAQLIYPKDMTSKRIDALEVFSAPDGIVPDDISVPIFNENTQAYSIVPRPSDFVTAFTQQRHFNWDVFISTPSIDSLHVSLRQGAEYGYLHKALSGKIPFLFKNSWYEFQHSPANNGAAKANQIGSPRRYKADTRIFKCYRSTATGKHVDSKAGQSIIGDGTVRFKLFFIFVSFALSGYLLSVQFKHKKKDAPIDASVSVPAAQTVSVSSVPVLPDTGKIKPNPPDHVSDRQIHKDDFLGFKILAISSHEFYYSLSDSTKRLEFIIDHPVDGLQFVTYERFYAAGARAVVNGLCDISLIAPGVLIKLNCFHDSIKYCASIVKTPNSYIARGCSKLIKPKTVYKPDSLKPDLHVPDSIFGTSLSKPTQALNQTE